MATKGSGSSGSDTSSGTVTFTVTISRMSAENLWIALGNALKGKTGGGKKTSQDQSGGKGPVVKSGGTPRRRRP